MGMIIQPARFAAVATSYLDAVSTGNRTSLITVTHSGFDPFPINDIYRLVDGAFANVLYWNTNNISSTAGRWIKFDFGSPGKIIDEFKWYQDVNAASGDWQFQGSNDNSSWTDLGSPYTMNIGTFSTPNSVRYRYYRIFGVGGIMKNTAYQREIEFKAA